MNANSNPTSVQNDVQETQGENAVHVDSLPWSLRHCGPNNALDDAKSIAVFLYETTTTERVSGLRPDDVALGDWHEGLRQCFHLLIDKLDIASGTYEFPSLTHERSAPCLCRRHANTWGDGHE